MKFPLRDRFAEKESDESVKSTEPIDEVPLVLGESELNRLVRVDGEKPGVDFRNDGKAYWKKDLLFVEKMMAANETSQGWRRLGE